MNVQKTPTAKPEGIRAWYSRTTKKARKLLVWLTICSLSTIGIMYAFASLQTLARLQTANGALTIPLIGGLWIFSFIFMFLVPSREASFRGQEALEEGVDVIREAVNEKISPAVEVWLRIGQNVEREFPIVLKRVHETLDSVKASAAKLEAAVEKNERLVEDVKPAIEALRRIEGKVEQEIKTGFFEEFRSAVQTMRTMGLPTGEKEEQPDLDWALQTIRNGKAKTMPGKKA